MEFNRQGEVLCIRGFEYELSLKPSEGPRAQLKLRGAPVADLYLASSCHANGGMDVLLELGSPKARVVAGKITIELEARSSLWPRKTYVLECLPDRLEYYYRLYGRGAIDDCLFLAGSVPSDPWLEMSTPYFTRLFNPEPNAEREQYSLPSQRSLIGVRSDGSYHRGNWFFTPAPFCYCLQVVAGDWLAAGLIAGPDKLNFASYEYLPDRGFGLRLAYEGQTEVSVAWESPHLLLQPAKGEYEALESYCAYLFHSGTAPVSSAQQYSWWTEPIFCGWGQQVNMAAKLCYGGGDPAALAAGFATQQSYERFLDLIETKGLQPGIVIVDDKWQSQYGLNWPDQAKWPRMVAFVSKQHQIGRKVLLWLKAWDPEGIPANESLLDENGEAAAVDPSHPGYKSRLRAQVRAMLADLDVDGFKVDFTHKLPSGKVSQRSPGFWGVRLLKSYLQTIYEEAKQVKPDALIMAHAANPYFADVVDMIRLNDVANIDGEESFLASMEHRAKVARAASPHWLIDTDNWPSPSKEAWREYVVAQPGLGVPSLYYTSGISYLQSNGQLREEEFNDSDYEAVALAWERYRRSAR